MFVVTGTNDAPVVSGPVTLSVLKDQGGSAAGAPAQPALPVDAKSTKIEDALVATGLPAAQVVNSVLLVANATDVDQGSSLPIVGLPAALPSGIRHIQTAPYYTPSPLYYGAPVYHPGLDLLVIDPTDAFFQSLAQGEVMMATVNYGVTDGIATTAASTTFTITGTNDIPIVSGPDRKSVV